MKKWKHTLLVSTLVLGSVPYNAVISPNHASAAEVEDQTAEKSVATQPDSTVESNAEEVQSETRLSEKIPNASEVSQVENENANPVLSESVKESGENSNSEILQITPRRTADFILTVDGVEEALLQENYMRTNVKTFTFARSDKYNERYDYMISLNEVPITSEIPGNVVDLSGYTDEGIYLIDLAGYTAQNRADSGEFFNNVQRTASSVNIDGVVNNPNEVVKDPTSIVVDRDINDNYGDYTYSWVISGTDLAGNLIEIKGDNTEVKPEDLASLPPGNYTITNTVNETVPEGFAPAEITDITSGAFKMSGGSVVVEHILLDKDGNETVDKTEGPEYGRLDADYTTSSIDIKGYKVVEEKKPANQNGKYTESEQIVKYYYEKIKTNINVKYVDEAGVDLLIKDPLTGDYGDPYQTTKEDIYGYELVANPENASGNYTDQDQTVTYVYKKKATQVNVHYVDKNGNPLSDDTLIPGVFDKDYTTTPKDIPGYIVTVVPNNAVGKHTVEPTEVTYVYEKIKTTINVEYVDEQGNPIATEETIPGEYGDNYTAEPKDIHGYEIVENPENATGTFTDQDQTVTYVYKKKATQVNVHYVDKDGKKLSESTLIDGVFDKDYTTTPKDIPGYIVKVVPNNATGKHTVEPTEVTYVYEKINTNIHVEYVDEQGNPITEGKNIPGEYGDNYTTEPKDIPGYDLVAEPTNPNGTFTDQDQTVKYVYKKKETKVNVHFVDEKGKSLADDLVKDGLFDDPYSTEPASIPGYILVEVPSNASGKHTADPTEVTYVYKKIEAPTVNDTLEGAKTVSGKGMPDSQVIVTFPNGSTITVDVDKDGNWQADVPEDIVLKKGDNVTAVTLDPKTGSTSDSGKGKVLPLVTKLPDTGTSGNTEKLVDPANPANTKTTAKITSSDPLTRSASTTKSASGKQLPNTGEEAGAYAVNLGLFALILAFFGKLLKKRETE
ncbi:MucBP domain-containing protein [Enterococcus sp. 5H]|uniref:MucBP domain-containing protein n=1 Tax=Enterococcus sp. 5H TaxID=1229490 RepID=UPI002303DABD|nr:MucBP domain-containing protein [Enterococcus sp. 5H]MDA9470008.1 Internalin-like protein (LPXTG motif) [Enterococcus sp. 5H]